MRVCMIYSDCPLSRIGHLLRTGIIWAIRNRIYRSPQKVYALKLAIEALQCGVKMTKGVWHRGNNDIGK